MQQSNAGSGRRLFWWISLFGIIFFVLGIGILCYLTVHFFFPHETMAPETFPDTDVVFAVSGKQVGFVNADGTGLRYVPIVIKVQGSASLISPSRPVITGDSKTLIVKVRDPFTYPSLPAWLAVSQAGKFPMVCYQWASQQMAYLSTDQQEIYIQKLLGDLQRYKLSSCGTNDGPLEIYENDYGILSPDQKYIVHTRETGAELEDDHLIIVRELASGEEQTIGIGDYPAWSRDSRWIAYTGKDGIYIVNVLEGRQAQLIAPYEYPYPDNEDYPVYETDAFWKVPPEVAWSPDGKWLVYHKWKADRPGNMADPADYAIYKVNITTGQEIMVVDDGMYPYWRWPAEER